MYLRISLLLLAPIISHANCVQEYNDRLPWQSIEACDEYKDADIELNSNYQILLNLLDMKNKKKLKAVQHEWIKWRDEKCIQAENNSVGTCSNVSCLGLAKDTCLIDLTKARNKNLLDFMKNIHKAEEMGFYFEKER